MAVSIKPGRPLRDEIGIKLLQGDGKTADPTLRGPRIRVKKRERGGGTEEPFINEQRGVARKKT